MKCLCIRQVSLGLHIGVQKRTQPLLQYHHTQEVHLNHPKQDTERALREICIISKVANDLKVPQLIRSVWFTEWAGLLSRIPERRELQCRRPCSW